MEAACTNYQVQTNGTTIYGTKLLIKNKNLLCWYQPCTTIHVHQHCEALRPECVAAAAGDVAHPSLRVVVAVLLEYLQILEVQSAGTIHGDGETEVDRAHLQEQAAHVNRVRPPQ